ncbi:EamA family transporter [Aetokthonos hydrillicola Thurmond2011]|jgi:undecaprenyl phosphate-alpha-L-ara4N flippase subunit ArnE|uniref:EamA family transporter n=1 Tax=Aetokthonos hydrillicola Thurmond2011 TaxID=2712845 RepID=A0AAP5M8C3_9CYAN|nr:EamA family transporter [Aetokthonos hydrillicola]MBO3462943.1 EamA family transporter [Aetokthonos hydrillicola CCALA 1050]MBW4585687.1 EamA family transporter [Aetokthonos hydrillicola CCALA 1050]MDR9894587.1 EamA family transporter [Aetokthonos hydrillicola Thurmond2011]
MNIISWLILMLVVVLGTVGQLSLKYAFQSSTSVAGASKSLRDVLFSPYFWVWFISYVVVTILWLVVLKTIPLSQAFPALGLTFALVPLASHRFLQEKVVLSQWLGIVIIITGVILVVQK